MSAQEAAREAVRLLDVGADLAAARAETTGARTSWAPVELEAILDGDHLDAPPSFLHREDGARLVYPQKMHALSGEPESCKGWLALEASRERLAAGERVLYFDFEDTAASVVGRLRALGVDREAIAERFRYIRPDEPLDDRAWQDLAPALALAPTLAVIDGVTEALALHGLDLRDNTDVAKWLELLPRRLVAAGAAVLLLDHVTKDREARGRFAIGAQHKLAGVDVAYSLEVVQPFGRGRQGLVKVKVAKDRPGHVRQHAEGDRMADMHLHAQDGAVTVELHTPLEPGASFRPTAQMERVSRAIEEQPGLSSRAVRTAVKGRNEIIDLALELLLHEGYIEPRDEGRVKAHYSVRAYREVEDVNNRARPCPDRAPAQSVDDRAHVPAPIGGTARGTSTDTLDSDPTVPKAPDAS